MLCRKICVDCCELIDIPTYQKQASGPGQWHEVYKGSLPNTSCRHLVERCHQQKAVCHLPKDNGASASCMQFSLIFPCSLMVPSIIWWYFLSVCCWWADYKMNVLICTWVDHWLTWADVDHAWSSGGGLCRINRLVVDHFLWSHCPDVGKGQQGMTFN